MEDDFSVEHHLTAGGWVEGTHRSFGKVSKKVERPQNAVETWAHRTTQSSPGSQEKHHVQMLWCDESVPENEREELHAKFERPFPQTR